MEHDLRLTIFWIVHLLMLGLFGVEMLFVISVWYKARVPGVPATASRWRKLWATVVFAIRLIFSRRIWTLLKALDPELASRGRIAEGCGIVYAEQPSGFAPVEHFGPAGSVWTRAYGD